MRIEEDMRVLRTFTIKLIGKDWTTSVYLYDNEARNELKDWTTAISVYNNEAKLEA